MAKKLLFIVNPCAGKKRIAPVLSEVIQVFCDNGYLPTVLMTQYAGHGRELVEAYGADADLIVCAGGDGTLNETISGLMAAGVDKPVGYLPCGSTNDLASTLGLSTDPVQAAKNVMNGREMPLDIGVFNGRKFVYTASFGAFTEVSYATSQSLKNTLGHLAYVLEGVKSLTQIKPVYARIVTDSGEYEGEWLFGSVSNTTSLAGILTLDKELVVLDDGLFEMLIVDAPKSAGDIAKLLVELGQKKFGGMLHLYNVKRAVFDMKEPLDWTLDGEQEKGDTHFEIENLNRAARLMV